jgi:tape measure domain-containing protein
VAEQIAEAVLKITADTTPLDAGIQRSKQEVVAFGNSLRESLSKSVDTKPLEAGLQRARQEAEKTAAATEQAFTRSGKALQTAANGLQYYVDAQGRARDATGRFVTQAQLQAAGIEGIGKAASGSARSIGGLQSRLDSLRQSYNSVEIGSKEFRKLQAEIRKAEQELQKVDRTLGETFRQRAGGFGAGLLGALGLGVGVGAGAAIGGFLKGAIDQAVELETITRKLSNTLGPQGAGGALSFTSGLAKDLGLNFKQLSNSFAGFTAAATAASVPLETQKNLFAAVSKAGQSLGLSNDEVQGSFLALQQVASKGTVAMEELRGQLGERLPIALSATAKGLGITIKELIKLVESGRLTAAEFFPALTKGLNELTAGSEGFATASQNFAKLANAWEQLQASFGTNLLPGVTKSVIALAQAIEGIGIGKQASELGFNVAPFLGPDATATQVTATLNSVAQRYNLNPTQARNIFSEAIKAGTGNKAYTPFGLSILDSEVPGVLNAIEDRAKAFRDRNPDARARQQAAEAAAKAEADRAIQREQQRQADLDRGLRGNRGDLELKSLQERLGVTRSLNQQDEAGRTKLQNRLAINEKIRAVQALQLDLQRELEKPKATGPLDDGKNGRQSSAKIQELQQRIDQGRIGIAQQREEARQSEAAAVRAQQERRRQLQLDRELADNKLQTTQQQTALEEDALKRQGKVSATAQTELQNRQAIGDVLARQRTAQQALQAELNKPKAEQDKVVLEDTLAKVAAANRDVRQAYAEAGLALVKNAQSAAAELKAAGDSLNGILRGGFEFLNPQLQQQQLDRARASIQPLVDNGTIKQGIDISTPDKLFRLAGFAEQAGPAQKRLEDAVIENAKAQKTLTDQLIPSQKQLQQALEENAKVTEALIKKNWDVNVTVVTPRPRGKLE